MNTEQQHYRYELTQALAEINEISFEEMQERIEKIRETTTMTEQKMWAHIKRTYKRMTGK